MSKPDTQRKPPQRPNIAEKGAPRDGQPQEMDRRLFMQLLAFEDCKDTAPLIAALEAAGHQGVLYEDLNHPSGVALLSMSEDPAYFADDVRRMLNQPPFDSLVLRPEFTMLGRTYALGYEPDLEDTLFGRPRRTVLNPAWNWSIWYPLRRAGEFEHLPADEQRKILMEHGTIGRSFGEADYAHDIRLMCHGLDASDNDFVIGLIGKALHPLSAIVQAMRKTQQTSLYLTNLGPFLVARAVWQARL